jgi:tRNA A-37 threonylcarbamoyl transferase component Bud32/tetratricopeptide (TPR) repeat protein
MAQPPQKLGKYEIKKELGKGAMGVVYEAYDPVLERKVALKVMAATTVSDEELKRRFEQEAKAVARAQHPNIVTVFDLGYDDQGAPWFAMEYLDGSDLESRIRSKPLTFVEKLEIIMQVCRGLEHAHKNGIVHRDIKPANIRITESADVKIMDFGVARLTQSSQTQTGAILGTADYMSPEQIRGHKVDGRSDIFAVGVILFRMLTGKKPFKGENIQSVFFKILNSDAPELLMPDGRKIPELQAIVDRAMAKDADERYGAAGEMAGDLSQFLQKYKGAIAEETIMEPAFDPGSAAEHDSSGRMRRSTIQPGTGTGRMPGTAGGVSRTHRPMGGTVAAPTAAGAVPGTIGGTVSRPTSVVPGTRIARPPRPMPAAPPSRGVLPLIIGVFVVLGLAAGGYYLYDNFIKQPTTETTDLASRFDFAENALENERFSQAFDTVENILAIDPGNQRALTLKAQIQEALAQQDEAEPQEPVQQPVATTSVAPTPVAPSGPTPEQRAGTLVADASMAINRGDIDGARGYIAQGRKIAPSDPRWSELNQQIARKEEELRQLDIQQKTANVVAGNLKQAGDYMAAKDYDRALAAYDKILEVDPNNTAAIQGRNSAITLKQMEEATRAPAMATRDFQQTQTEFISAKGDAPAGFQSGGGVSVKKATSGPGFAGELIIELNPPNAQPGQPYELRVRLHNRGNGVITVKFLELVSTYSGKSTGKGQQIPPKVQRVSAQANSVLHEVRGTWSEAQNQGSITATLTLVGNARVTKTLSW